LRIAFTALADAIHEHVPVDRPLTFTARANLLGRELDRTRTRESAEELSLNLVTLRPFAEALEISMTPESHQVRVIK